MTATVGIRRKNAVIQIWVKVVGGCCGSRWNYLDKDITIQSHRCLYHSVNICVTGHTVRCIIYIIRDMKMGFLLTIIYKEWLSLHPPYRFFMFYPHNIIK